MESHTSRHTLLLFICITADAFARATMPVIVQSPQVRTAMPATASVRSLPALKSPVVQVPVAAKPVPPGPGNTAGAAPVDSTTTTPAAAKIPNLRSAEQLRREMAESKVPPVETKTDAPVAVKPELHSDDSVPDNAEQPRQGAGPAEAPVVVASMLSPNGDGTQPESAAPPAAAPEVSDMKQRQREVMPEESTAAPKVEDTKAAEAETPPAAGESTPAAAAAVAANQAVTESATAAAAAVAANQAAVAAEVTETPAAAAGAN